MKEKIKNYLKEEAESIAWYTAGCIVGVVAGYVYHKAVYGDNIKTVDHFLDHDGTEIILVFKNDGGIKSFHKNAA